MHHGQILKLINTHVANGGNTATAVNPAGTRAKDWANVELLVSEGEPPPRRVPGCAELKGACPLCWKFRCLLHCVV